MKPPDRRRIILFADVCLPVIMRFFSRLAHWLRPNMPVLLLVAPMLLISGCELVQQSVHQKDYAEPYIVELNNKADALFSQGRYKDALQTATKASSLATDELGSDALETARSYNNIGRIYLALNQFGEAEQYFQKSYKIRNAQLGPNHIDTNTVAANLGALYRESGRLDQAEPALLSALAVREQLLGPNHSRLSVILNNLGLLYEEKGNNERAKQYFQRALSIEEGHYGAQHKDTNIVRNNLIRVDPGYVRDNPQTPSSTSNTRQQNGAQSRSSQSQKPTSISSPPTTSQQGTSTALARPTLPENGARQIYVNRPAVAPLVIKTKGDKVHYLIKLTDWETGKLVQQIFVRAGHTVDTTVPLGAYHLKYAAGEQWYDEQALFGEKTLFMEAKKRFDFKQTGTQISGYIVELILQLGGNLRTVKIPRGQW